MKAYFISGLGADRRAFYRIQMPSSIQIVHLDWIDPLPKESLNDYALRFSKLIDRHEEFILVGLSFGGMLAVELGKFLQPQKIILISSLSNNTELPWYFRFSGKVGLHKLLTPAVYKQATLLNRFMGAGDAEMKAIVYSYVRDIDPRFIRWSLEAILHWQLAERHPSVIHIHGSKDHLLPLRYVKADFVVENGGHLMVMNRPQDVNRILATILSPGQASSS